MTDIPDPALLDRATLLNLQGTLLVLRGEDAAAEIFLAIGEDGRVTAFNGHVDLGTGIGTALAQIVAEELDVAFDKVSMVLGHSGRTPNQGSTIASETIQVTAVPLRLAAATARRFLLDRAAELFGSHDLLIEDGMIRAGNRAVGFGELVAGQRYRIAIDAQATVKSPDSYSIVGQAVARSDIPAKVTGSFTYVHDIRVQGMLHGRVVRPPYAGLDTGAFVGRSLVSVDETSIAGIPGVIAVVAIGDFVGVVTEREEHAVQAAAQLKLVWSLGAALPDLNQPQTALRENASTPRVLRDTGDVDAAIAAAVTPMPRTYLWPYQMHASIGPSCAVADYREDGLVVWSGTQNPVPLRADLARLMGLDESRIEIFRHEAAGCYGRNCADDVTADAALLSRAVGRPVRVQLSREQEHAWEPKGAAQVIDVAGGLDAAGQVAGYDFSTCYPSNLAPTLALLLTGVIPAVPGVTEMGDRTAIPPYGYRSMRVTVHDMAPIVRASWLRGVSSLPNSFAHESWIDECATEAGVDPVEYRLRYLDDPRAVDLVHAVADRAQWVPHEAPLSHGGDGDIAYGRGFAYAVYVHGRFPGTAAAWSAWVADVAVNRVTGEVAVTKVTVGQDTGQMINPAGVRHQIHGNVIQASSRALTEQVIFDSASVVSREWGGYPIMTFPQVPVIDVVMMQRPHDPPLGAGESASVPSAAAIANAIFDATGVRFREVPFTPERILAGLHGAAPPTPKPRRRRGLAAILGALTGAFGMAAVVLPWRPGYAPIPRPDASVFSTATIERGRQVAAVGLCAVCHTGPELARFAGGLALDTPFGRVWSTNISPDVATGIGAWSYPAFERAMRDGISRDGHHLYPAHPYTAFAGAGDADLQALYAFLMAQPAVTHTPPPTRLAFPFGLRPLMAVWNSLFLRQTPFVPDAMRTAQWNRGAYLVEMLGHCGACHTPRNPLGAERTGERHLAGAVADGWEAPALTDLSHAPVPWTEAAFFDYLRTGFSPAHGVAAGPMAPVVASLADVPDADLRAMAVYLASLSGAISEPDAAQAMAKAERSVGPRVTGSGGARLYEGACAVCHEAGAPAQFGVKPSLALASSLHSAMPDNLIRVILDGISAPAQPALGVMPGFADGLGDRQVAELATYLRARFAPGRPEWESLEAQVARIRAGHVEK